MNFRISVSEDALEDKRMLSSMRYVAMDISMEEFEGYVRKGHVFCHDFGFDNFSMKQKIIANFRGASFVWVDVDDSPINIYECIGNLICKPTFAYTTMSNGIKGYRFRLVYLFEDILSKEEYEAVYDSITECLDLKDNCGKSVAQCMIGNIKDNIEVYQSGSVYRKTDFDISEAYVKGKTKNVVDKRGSCIGIDKAFIDNLYTNKPTDFIDMYRGVFEFIDRSSLILSDDATHYTFPKPYYEIHRKGKWSSFRKNDDDIKVFKVSKQFRDGDQRRKKLFVCAVIKCRIKPTVTIEELIWNMVYERYVYYDNTDCVLSNNVIIEICRNAIDSDMEIEEDKHPEFIVNDVYAYENGLTPNQLKMMVRKQYNEQAIAEWYDFGKSVDENLKYAKDNGIKVSRRKLYDFKKSYD